MRSRRVTRFFAQFAMRALHETLAAVLRPATSSHKYCFAAWRYCRISKIRPSGNTGSTTTDPGCTTTLRDTFKPLGSITLSRRTSKTLAVKTPCWKYPRRIFF